MKSLLRIISRNFSKRNKRRKKREAKSTPLLPNEQVKPLDLKQEVVKTMFFGDVQKDQEETEHLYDAIKRYKQVKFIFKNY